MLLKLDWLVESIAKRQAITEYDKYIYRFSSCKSNNVADDSANVPSPASKRNILSMSGSSLKPSNRRRLEFASGSELTNRPFTPNNGVKEKSLNHGNENLEDIIIDQYLSSTVVQDNHFKVPQALVNAAQLQTSVLPPVDQSLDSEHGSDYSLTFSESNFLNGFTVYILGFDTESNEALIDDCKAAGAVVIIDDHFKGSVDYLILPLDILSMNDVQVKAKHIVNQHWLVWWPPLMVPKINLTSSIFRFTPENIIAYQTSHIIMGPFFSRRERNH